MHPISDEQWTIFFSTLAQSGVVKAACIAAEIHRSTVYDYLEKGSEEWKKRYRIAEEEAADTLEAEAFRRAHDGYDEPVFFQGIECGKIRRYSDALMVRLLQARRPSKFKNNVAAELSGPDGGPIKTVTRVIALPVIQEGAEE